MEPSPPAAASAPSTLGDFSLEFQFNPLSDLSSSENALSFTSGILPAVYYRADARIADQIATFAFNHVSSRGWFYGLSMSVLMETIHVFDEERRSEGVSDDDDDLLDYLSDDYEEVDDLLLLDEDQVNIGDTSFSLGMSEPEISMLRTEQVTDEDNEEGDCCCICLERLFIRGVVITSLSPCSHRFHHTCILQWLHNKSTCPICRSRCTLPIS